MRAPSHQQSAVHLEPVREHVEEDEGDEEHVEGGVPHGEKDEEARSSCPVCHHVEHCSKGGSLVEHACEAAVELVADEGEEVGDDGLPRSREGH